MVTTRSAVSLKSWLAVPGMCGLFPGSCGKSQRPWGESWRMPAHPFTPIRSSIPHESPAVNDRDTLQFLFVLTAQEFCIWRRNRQGQVEAWEIDVGGQRYVGARGIAAAHVRALRRGKDLLTPEYLASMTMDDVREFYRDERTGDVTLQMLPQRLAKFNEVGRVLADRYGGHVANVLERAGGALFRDDGWGLAQQLLLNFPAAYFDWPFCKLAFLFAKFFTTRKMDGVPTTDEYRALSRIEDPENFEMAADYYIPLFFYQNRHLRDRRCARRSAAGTTADRA